MNKILTAMAICCSIIIFSFKSVYSQNPTYTLKATNFVRAADSLTFDIMLLHTNSGTAEFKYALGQFLFRFNPAISNGGTLTYRIIASDLQENARPRNPTVVSNELRLSSNPVIGVAGAPTVSSTAPGTLIVRMSLKTSAAAFSASESLNLTWKNPGDPVPFTKLFAYVGTVSTEITTGANHTIEDPSSINQISTEIPEKFELLQNYPNPFNPVTNLEFGIAKLGFVSLKVYNVLGKEVATLVNSNLRPGTYKYDFDASGLTSGIYFYTLQANGFVETKRMMLLK